MAQTGTHTWEIEIRYHRCPKCGYILESRQPYQYRLGIYQKDLECSRCHHLFTFKKPERPTFGPLIGKGQPVEIDWS